jgi:hypothetical protein
LTGTPIMANGKDGQIVTLFNSHASHSVTLSGERAGSTLAAVANTNISDPVILGNQASVQMRYSATTGSWHPAALLNPQSAFTPGGVAIYSAVGDQNPRVSMGAFLTVSFLNMGAGGATATDTYLSRTAAGVFGVGIGINATDGVIHAGHRMTVTAQTGTSYVVANADDSRTITRNNAGASTQDYPSDANAADLAIGTIVHTFNRGAGVITHQAGSGATVDTTGTQATKTWWKAMKVAANTWVAGPG